MAKDDLHVILFKVLTIYYAKLKRKINFTDEVFKTYFKEIDSVYFDSIINIALTNGYLEGGSIIKTFGGENVVLSTYSDFNITLKGVEYLQNNSTMAKVKQYLLESVDLILSVINLINL